MSLIPFTEKPLNQIRVYGLAFPMDIPFAFSEFTEEDIEGSRSAIGRFGRTERKNDTLKRFLGKPLLNFLSEDGYTMRRVQAASGHHEDRPLPFEIRRTEKAHQSVKSLLRVHPMQVQM